MHHPFRALAIASALALTACQGELEFAPTQPGGPGGEDAHTPGEPVPVPMPMVTPVTPDQPLACVPESERPGAPRAWRLTRNQLDTAASQLAGRPITFGQPLQPESSTERGFKNTSSALRIGDVDALTVETGARELATIVATERFGEVFPCTPDMLGDEECVRSFVEGFGQDAFRRPLEADEVDRYTELYQLAYDGLGGTDQGVRAVVEAMAQSAQFLYRAELVADPSTRGPSRLTQHAIAEALALTLWNAPPDESLLALASEGGLGHDGQVAEVARQMMQDPRAIDGMTAMYRQWFGVDELALLEKNPDVFPDFPTFKPVLMAQADVFFEDVLTHHAGSFEALMTTSRMPVDATTAPLYGLDASAFGQGVVMTEVPGRAGVLSLPAVMTTQSTTTDASIAKRGVMVIERVLCDHIEDPPAGVFDDLPDHIEGESERAFFERTTEGPGCNACHAQINPGGYALDVFDGVGALRTQPDGSPWPTTAVLERTRDIDGPIDGPVELASALAASAQVRECAVQQHMRYALGRDVGVEDSCSMTGALDAFESSGWDVRELMIAVVSSRAFLYRDNP